MTRILSKARNQIYSKTATTEESPEGHRKATLLTTAAQSKKESIKLIRLNMIEQYKKHQTVLVKRSQMKSNNGRA